LTIPVTACSHAPFLFLSLRCNRCHVFLIVRPFLRSPYSYCHGSKEDLGRPNRRVFARIPGTGGGTAPGKSAGANSRPAPVAAPDPATPTEPTRVPASVTAPDPASPTEPTRVPAPVTAPDPASPTEPTRVPAPVTAPDSANPTEPTRVPAPHRIRHFFARVRIRQLPVRIPAITRPRTSPYIVSSPLCSRQRVSAHRRRPSSMPPSASTNPA